VNDIGVEQEDFWLLALTQIEFDSHVRGRITPDLDDAAADLVGSPRDNDSVSDIQGPVLLYHGDAPVRT